jgi:hypothetical protein
LVEAAKEGSFDQQRIVNTWYDDADWPASELAALETQRLLRLAKRYDVDEPAQDDWITETPTGYTCVAPVARLRLKRAIRTARREAISWWLQVTIGPLTGLIGTTVALLAFLTHRGK